MIHMTQWNILDRLNQPFHPGQHITSLMDDIPKYYDHRGGAVLILSPRRGIAWIRLVFRHGKEQPAGNPKADDEQVEEDRPRAERSWSEVVSRYEAGDSFPHSDRERHGCLQHHHRVSLACFRGRIPTRDSKEINVLTMLRASPLWPSASFLVTDGSSASSGLRTAPCHLRT